MKRVIVPLADGFEEIEAITVIDILRRCGINVVIAGVGVRTATGSHDIKIVCDGAIEEYDAENLDAIVLPGGLPGTTHLNNSRAVQNLIAQLHRSGKIVAAICAAPTILNSRGYLDGKRATGHPNHQSEMDRCHYERHPVVTDGNLVTSRGAGTAIEFSAELVRQLAGDDAAREVLAKIVFHVKS